MVKTLHITGAVAVVLAVVVVASVLGVQRPASLIHLQWGERRGNKQIEKILGGPSAVERFKEQHAGKVPSGEDATPPLVKQAELFANIINPPALPEMPAATPPSHMPARPGPVVKPLLTSTKFDLLGICHSSNPQTSLAYIRLPDSTYQWVAQGSEIGHVTVKEIRKSSIVCWDGSRDVEMPVEPTPETSSLLETGNAPVAPAAPLPRPTVGGKSFSSPIKPPVASNRATAATVPMSSAQISREEQQALGNLGDKLKAGVDAGAQGAAADKLIAAYKAARGDAPEGEKRVGPAVESDGTTDASKDNSREELRRQFMKRFNKSRPTEK